ncbi:MAG: hypothetical protein ACTS9Y_00655 [Methylophilus sp.]|uniref:hypothetical protein n=1 Tax=Methylophilus sp. TaxID=29541 RepID=UPI003FA01C06
MQSSNIDWKQYYKSQADFVLAEFTDCKTAYETANKVQCLINNKVVTVADIITEGCNHKKDVFVYTAWLVESEYRVLRQLEKMTGVPHDALRYVINHHFAKNTGLIFSLESMFDSKEMYPEDIGAFC